MLDWTDRHCRYLLRLISRHALLYTEMVTTGAREKMLSFPGNTLPGVYGAGAFQTLVNRDLVKSSEKVLIVGGGNVAVDVARTALRIGAADPRIVGHGMDQRTVRVLEVPLLFEGGGGAVGHRARPVE